MRLLKSGMLGLSLIAGAGAQWYGGYDTSQGVTVVVNPAAPPPPANVTNVFVNPPPMTMREPARPRQATYLIAFTGNVVRLADNYWVRGNTLYYVSPDRKLNSASLGSLDRALTYRLNAEQNVAFILPGQPSTIVAQCAVEEQLAGILETHHTGNGLAVDIPDVLFEFNQATLTAAARQKLSKVAAVLSTCGGVNLHLEGHTDNIGSAAFNLQLSRRRADSVWQFLIARGVQPNSLTIAALGEEHPVASNSTAAGRQQNRRVELIISNEPAAPPPTSTYSPD